MLNTFPPLVSLIQLSRNSGIADVRDVSLAVDFQVMNFRLEGVAHLAGGAGEINEHVARINNIDPETVRSEPSDVKVRPRHAELSPNSSAVSQ